MAIKPLALGVGLAVAALAVACTSTTDIFDSSPGVGGSGNSTQTGGSSPSSSSSSGASSSVGGSGASGGSGGSSMCNPVLEAVDLPDLDMALLVDRSGSMGVNGKLGDEVSQLSSWVQAPKPPGTRVAVIYHPAQNAAAICAPASYPASVPFTAVPSAASTIVNSLGMQMAGGASPWLPELEAGIQTAATTQNAGRVSVVVWMVDSPDTACASQPQAVANAVGNLFTNTGVRTFVIGFEGAPIDNLHLVANAGGTGQAINLTAMGAIMQLGANMQQILGRAVPCDYALPATITAEDPNTLEVHYTPGGMGPPQTIPRVDSVAQCGNGPGWYANDNTNPTSVSLCAATCGAVKSDATPLVELVAGCP